MIAGKLKEYQAENIVVDPVMVATSGAKLISDDAIETLKSILLPMATVITSEHSGGRSPFRRKDHQRKGDGRSGTYDQQDLSLCGIIKGGHQLNDANDLLCREGEFRVVQR